MFSATNWQFKGKTRKNVKLFSQKVCSSLRPKGSKSDRIWNFWIHNTEESRLGGGPSDQYLDTLCESKFKYTEPRQMPALPSLVKQVRKIERPQTGTCLLPNPFEF
jgi:hypothetical protein